MIQPCTLHAVSLSLLALAMAATSCSDDSGSGGAAFSVEWDAEKSIHPDSEGAAVIVISAPEGTPWTAEIIAGEEWVSFDRTSPGSTTTKSGRAGTSLAARNLYLYYWPNRTHEERQATVRFTFDGRPAEELVATQFTTSPEGDVYTNGQAAAWPEIPARSGDADYRYITHLAPMAGGGDTIYTARNYTMCYDRTKFAAWWVAYPLHSSYVGSGRTETWAYDPKLAIDWQAELSRSYPSPQYDRGHQIPNADRNAVAAMQAQTFYFSNMTPQTATLNQQSWAALEKMARDNWICSDTLYVVTGAWWGSGTATTPDRTGRLCPVPDYYFKAFARTSRGNIRRSGDRLGDYAASELKTIAFWCSNSADAGSAREWVCSIAELEQLTGFEFFPTLDPEVKRQRDAASWGL